MATATTITTPSHSVTLAATTATPLNRGFYIYIIPDLYLAHFSVLSIRKKIYIYLMSLTYLCDLRFTELTYVTFSLLYLNIRLDYFSHLIVCLIQVDNK